MVTAKGGNGRSKTVTEIRGKRLSVGLGNFKKQRTAASSSSLSFVRFWKLIMAGGNFMHRVVSYVINELIVDRLANSPAFQRFAVRTSKKIEDISSMAAKTREELAEQMKEISKNMESKNR
ncbi:hypothetical protein V6N11_082809 [Hibiscus sabdariffa]|uniref:Uncharacterized protein n=1 Tax=Hibiscus sabdariffa TaxID=183260 RepID=A0ABR2QK17_9ROSI